MSVNLQISHDSPLELPSGCRDAMEEQARMLFRQEDLEEQAKTSGAEIPLPGKATVVNPRAEEIS